VTNERANSVKSPPSTREVVRVHCRINRRLRATRRRRVRKGKVLNNAKFAGFARLGYDGDRGRLKFSQKRRQMRTSERTNVATSVEFALYDTLKGFAILVERGVIGRYLRDGYTRKM
jgi:hypothetical protein